MTEQSLDDIMSARGEPESDIITAEPELSAEEQRARDERGRFAAKQEAEAQPIPGEQAQPQQPSGHVPIQALDSERNKRKELEERYEKDMRELRDQISRLSQPQQQAEQLKPPPALWDDPDAYLQHQLSPVQMELQQTRNMLFQMQASQNHGADKVQAAIDAVKTIAGTPEWAALDAETAAASNPFDALVKWHQRQSVTTEIGGDLEAYKARIIAEYVAANGQQQSQQPQQATQPAAGPMPTAFARTPSSGPRGGPEYGGPRPLSEIMGGR